MLMRIREKNWLHRKEASVRRGSGTVFFKTGVFGSFEGEESRG